MTYLALLFPANRRSCVGRVHSAEDSPLVPLRGSQNAKPCQTGISCQTGILNVLKGNAIDAIQD
jgi:hypothetical protein